MTESGTKSAEWGTAAAVRVGRYSIRREIGRGAMGLVFEARDTSSGETVALKTLAVDPASPPMEREALEARFLAQARMTAGLSHPGIVRLLDFGRDPDAGTPFIAFEYLAGTP